MSKRLLIIDDDPNLLMAIAAVLRGEGFEVTTARNGKDAILQIAKSLPDLIVSDVRMPLMDGFTLARQLRSAPHTKLIPIIFLTAKDETDDRIEGFRSGVDVYLTKPFEPNELIAVINNILTRVERTRSAITALASIETTIETESIYLNEELSEAEWKVADAVARGLSNKEIAVELELSVRTIENHVSRILSKMGLSNRVEIARYVLSKKSN
ncbi:MAG TPA: response regulator transcription factor [Pyrinomonadaceae bacterium]|nr:response regulator transcription factor [Pyrinomonadaceae bacterium]